MYIPRTMAELDLDQEHILVQMKACKMEMDAGIDYDWNQDEMDRLRIEYDRIRFNINSLRILR